MFPESFEGSRQLRHSFISSITFTLLTLGLSHSWAAGAEDSTPISGRPIKSAWQDGVLVGIQNHQGKKFVRPAEDIFGLSIHSQQGEYVAHQGDRVDSADDAGSLEFAYRRFTPSDGKQRDIEASGRLVCQSDSTTGDLVISQQCRTAQPGTWGVGWTVGRIPLEYNMIIPGRSGIRLTADSVGRRHEFDYPMGWEAQLVIVEGPDCGFYIWADDTVGRFKRLIVERDRLGWKLQLITINDAPFAQLTECDSVRWRLNTYSGDWRVPAKRYRDWATEQFRPTPLSDQQPDWADDIRAMVILGLDTALLEALPSRLIPEQTILYVPSWRAPGYDRDYPNYHDPIPALLPFVQRAHALGFRVMLHVNYFGVDPLHPAYEQFEPYHVRDPWNDHEKQWWLWTRAEPEIRFAYINPAAKAWRDYFTDAMVQLCRDIPVDALHLDQTLVIYNDHNGRIDGMSMVEGNIALHQQLRHALPHVALSGEGLNEITYRHEAFAQRHTWGVHHADGIWDRKQLELAHPICSYLFRPFVSINGYLGCAPPRQGQLYAAWQEAYEHWGVIPTLKTSLEDLRAPSGFSRQFFDEVSLWQTQELNVDLESDWPGDVAFPYVTKDGQRAVRTNDGRLLLGDQEVCRTVTSQHRVTGTGTIPGWNAFDQQQIFGLDPTHWYPYFNEPRDDQTFHVVELPAALIAKTVLQRPDMAIVETASSETIVADLLELIDDAEVGSRPFDAEPTSQSGPGILRDGAQFQRISDDILSAHPPWKVHYVDPETGTPQEHGTGIAFAKFNLQLPHADQLVFRSQVKMDSASIGKPNSDGATFGCVFRAGEHTIRQSIHHKSDLPADLDLDLTDLAGQSVTLELSLSPGPERKPSFDWARWIRPRIESRLGRTGKLTVKGLSSCSMAIGAGGPAPVKRRGDQLTIETAFPGTVFLLRQPPERVQIPARIDRRPHSVTISDGSGQAASAKSFIGVHQTESTVGSVTRAGLFMHPPQQGVTAAHLPLTLPDQPVVFRSWIGIRDGAKSNGVIFEVRVNGRTLFTRTVTAGDWNPVEIDLSPWRDSSVVLSLAVDSNGPYDCDWAHWGEPRIEAAPQ
jgi:hypothetical protein